MADQWVIRLKSWTDSGLALLFPPRCIGCQHWGWPLCPHCAQAVEPIGTQICWECGRPQARALRQCPVCRQLESRATARPIMTRISAYHQNPLSQAVYGLKYRGRKELAPLLARYLLATLLHADWREAYRATDGVVPVPLHRDRQRERGYNHAELLARAFCQQIRLPLHSNWLARYRATASQVGLTAHERQRNVADAFSANPAVQGKRIIVLDDVYTTGATINACAAALYDAGATAVYGLALACPLQPGSTVRSPQLGMVAT